MSFKL